MRGGVGVARSRPRAAKAYILSPHTHIHTLACLAESCDGSRDQLE